MRWGTKTRVALVALLLVGGYAAYRAGGHLWGLHHYRAAQHALARRDFRQGGFHLKQCLRAWPGDATVRLLAAQTARRRGDYDEARHELRLLEQQKSLPQERSRELELLAIVQGDSTGTEALLETCLNDPQTPGCVAILEVVIEDKLKALDRAYHLGMTLVEGPAGKERAQTEKAVDLWCQQCPGQADQAQALVWRGRIHLLSNQQEAARDFRQALELDPDHFDARLHLAAALVDYDPQEGARHLEILWQREPGNQQVGLLLATFYRSLGQLEEASRILDEVLAAHPEYLSALLERGKSALDAGRPEEAERFLRRGLALAPQEPSLHLALSRCLHLTGHEEQAKYHQQRYSDMEAERTQAEQVRAAAQRAAWRKRLELESPPRN